MTPQQVEAAWGYPDGNWACQVDLEQKFELPGSINLIENKDPEFYTNGFNLDTSYGIQTQAPTVNLDKRTRIQTQGLSRKGREVTKNTVNTKAILAAVMLIMAGSTIKSTQVDGDTSSSQLAICTQVGASTQ